jgi:hypothetical protein
MTSDHLCAFIRKTLYECDCKLLRGFDLTESHILDLLFCELIEEGDECARHCKWVAGQQQLDTLLILFLALVVCLCVWRWVRQPSTLSDLDVV